jgi:hypothetical protein
MYLPFTQNLTGKRTIRKLAQRVYPATIRQLAHLIEADHSGRPPLPRCLPEAGARMMALAGKHDFLDEPYHPAAL